MKKFLSGKYKELINYVFFGGLTTAVNIVSYVFFAQFFDERDVAVPTAFAWVTAVMFAYITNKIWVFNSRRWTFKFVAKELCLFVGARGVSGLIDLGIMVFFVTLMHMNDLFVKILSNIVVVIVNYIFSKLIIFKK